MKLLMKPKYSVRSIAHFCGACISFYIGAGFATMQELMQYAVSYGSRFFLVILVAGVIFCYTNLSFAVNSNRLKLERGGEIFHVYGSVLGKKAGRWISHFYDYFTEMFCYMGFIIMCGGAGSTMMEEWGFPHWAGALIMAALVILAVLLGFTRIVRILGRIGPVIILMIFLIAAVNACTGLSAFAQNAARIESGEFAGVIEQVGGGSPFLSGFSYGGMALLWFAPFVAELGAKNKLNEVNAGVSLSACIIFGVSFLCCAALIGHIDQTAAADIPALDLAKMVSPVFAEFFAVIVLAGIFSTAIPILWSPIRKFANEGTAKYRVLTIAGGLAGCLVSAFLPYKDLINIIYGLNGFLGFTLVFIMAAYDIRTRMSAKPNNLKSH